MLAVTRSVWAVDRASSGVDRADVLRGAIRTVPPVTGIRVLAVAPDRSSLPSDDVDATSFPSTRTPTAFDDAPFSPAEADERETAESSGRTATAVPFDTAPGAMPARTGPAATATIAVLVAAMTTRAARRALRILSVPAMVFLPARKRPGGVWPDGGNVRPHLGAVSGDRPGWTVTDVTRRCDVRRYQT